MYFLLFCDILIFGVFMPTICFIGKGIESEADMKITFSNLSFSNSLLTLSHIPSYTIATLDLLVSSASAF